MENNKYLENALHKDNCEYLTQFLKDCKENGTAENDSQCPTSWSVYHHPTLEKVLEAFLPKMEQETGKKLFPTYAYARHYTKGEVLECHTDRESCEYSATITLGHDGEVWPLFVGSAGEETDKGIVGAEGKIFRVKDVQQIHMSVGDAVIYKGCEEPHWRDKLESEWQTQIFLHYVDQDGPYAEWKYDKRPALSHQDQQQVDQVIAPQEPQEVLYWYNENAIAKVACDQMITKFESFDTQKAQIGADEGEVNTDIRDVNKLQLTNEIGIGATLTGIGLNMNQRAWKFDITHSNQTEYLRYDADGHYKTHVDTFTSPEQRETRKITVLAFLNDNFKGGRLYLENGHERMYPPQDKGTVIAFPSYINHGVEPVTKGIRRSIVTWLIGPWFK
jgi:hypothetical protein